MTTFSTEANGYNKKEVKAFIKETESLLQQITEKEAQIKKLEEELKDYREKDELLKNAILKTEEFCNKMKIDSQDESKKIIENAKEDASKIVNDALIHAKEVEKTYLLVEKNIETFKRKLRLIINQQLEVCDEIDKLELDGE